MSKKALFVFISVILIIICLLSCCVLFIVSMSSNTSVPGATGFGDFPNGKKSETVAVIDIDGIITETSTTDLWGNVIPDLTTKVINKLERAKNDENVKAVLIRVNSPGGEVYPTRKIYNKIVELQEEDKIVVVLMEGQAASGGYYISAPADWIVASEMTMTGSIGVKFSTYDLTELYNKIGVQELNIVNSKGKLKVLNDLSSENSEGYKMLQSLADDYYNNFINAIVTGREMTEEKVISVADGRVYSGKQALDNGLIDELGEVKEAVAKVTELASLSEPNFVVYEDNISPFSLYNMSLVDIFAPEAKVIKEKLSNGGLFAYYLMDY